MVGGDFPTFVWKSDNRQVTGFIQLYSDESSPLAHILFVGASVGLDGGNGNRGKVDTAVSLPPDAAEERMNDRAWLTLLDQAVVEVGKRGIHSLVAEVSETGPELPVLRRAGFVVYTRQDIWVLYEMPLPGGTDILRQRQEVDDWDIQLLYANTVPRLVQLVEPLPPLGDGTGWVLREDSELAAFVHIHDGPAATWLRLFVHPNAEARAEEIITAVLRQAPPRLNHPVYCCVRRYQSWVQGALGRTGFTHWGSQAVMVKHTVYHLQKPIMELSAMMDGQTVTPTTPMVRPLRQTHRSHW